MTDNEICARFLRHCGMAERDIETILGLPAAPTKPDHLALFDGARPVLARTLGDVADNFQTIGSA